jgi:hypothetical protein
MRQPEIGDEEKKAIWIRVKRNVIKIQEKLEEKTLEFYTLNMDAAYFSETFVPNSVALHSAGMMFVPPPWETQPPTGGDGSIERNCAAKLEHRLELQSRL